MIGDIGDSPCLQFAEKLIRFRGEPPAWAGRTTPSAPFPFADKPFRIDWSSVRAGSPDRPQDPVARGGEFMAQQEAVQISHWLGERHASFTCAACCGGFIVRRCYEKRPRGRSALRAAAAD